jgi:death on curing protein
MHEPVWITTELIEAIHERQLSEHGGPGGIRDRGMLESALARARQKYAYEPTSDLPTLAAAYAFGIATNHPFIDGNKRTAAVACELFLELNDYTLVAEDADMYPVFLSLATGQLTEAALADWLRANSRPQQVSEPADNY